MFGKYLLPIVLLVGVILFSSVVSPILNGIENFETESEKISGIHTPLICPGCKGEGQCTCYQTNTHGNIDDTKKYLASMSQTDNTTNLSSSDPTITVTPTTPTTPTTSTTSTTPMNVVSTIGTSGTIDPVLQGKHPMPYSDLVDIVKKNEEVEERQSKHIEDIRKVLANTITSLEKDDVLPSGSHCSCANAPVIDPLTGEVDLTDGCKPPGWLRMMNSRNARDEECTN